MKKYEFTGETMQFEGHTLHRIRYLRDFSIICEEDLGGWIESSHNLSHEGESVVAGDAKVFGNARIIDDAYITENAIVKDNALIMGSSYVSGTSIIGGDTTVHESYVLDDSKVFFYNTIEEMNTINFFNVFGESKIKDCNIEATGNINNCHLDSETWTGKLNLVDICTRIEE